MLSARQIKIFVQDTKVFEAPEAHFSNKLKLRRSGILQAAHYPISYRRDLKKVLLKLPFIAVGFHDLA